MQTKSLSDTTCKTAKYDPSGKGNKRADGGGMYLDLQPSGSKIWRMKFYFAGKENRLTFGHYPVVSLAEAREKRLTAKKLLAAGISPAQHRDNLRLTAEQDATNSFEAVAREWWQHQTGRWSASHAERIKRRLDIELLPFLGKRPIGQITAPELLTTVRQIETRGALETASKTLQTSGQIFRYAIATGRAERDPSRDLRGALSTRRVRHMSRVPERELPGLVQKIAAYDSDAHAGDMLTRLALQFLCLTFVRTIELRHAEWSEIDTDKAEWRIPGEKMKMGRPHIVPLSSQALAVLEELRPLTGHRNFLFPNSVHPQKPMSENTVLYALYRMGYRSRMTGHGFRGLASTILNENGFNSDWIERQLAHIEGNSVRAAYNHAEYLKERRLMMQWWGDYVEKAGQNVIELKRSA